MTYPHNDYSGCADWDGNSDISSGGPRKEDSAPPAGVLLSIYVACSVCLGACHLWVSDIITRCAACDGLGRQWAPGAPEYGCPFTLADREPGEVVTLGNGQRAKILWHQPRKRSKKAKPETTFIDLLEGDFFERETFKMTPYPSCIGVASVDNPRTTDSRDEHDHERNADPGDPLQRHDGDLWQHSVRAPDEPF